MATIKFYNRAGTITKFSSENPHELRACIEFLKFKTEVKHFWIKRNGIERMHYFGFKNSPTVTRCWKGKSGQIFHTYPISLQEHPVTEVILKHEI